jgi:hypothetical protein
MEQRIKGMIHRTQQDIKATKTLELSERIIELREKDV